eukprot:IDg21343t1
MRVFKLGYALQPVHFVRRRRLRWHRRHVCIGRTARAWAERLVARRARRIRRCMRGCSWVRGVLGICNVELAWKKGCIVVFSGCCGWEIWAQALCSESGDGNGSENTQKILSCLVDSSRLSEARAVEIGAPDMTNNLLRIGSG